MPAGTPTSDHPVLGQSALVILASADRSAELSLSLLSAGPSEAVSASAPLAHAVALR
jgi:hypothetical protein